MIRAAIVGLGRWGQNLVNSVRTSQAIRFTTANTRTQATAASFCADAGLRWVDSLDTILTDRDIDAVVFATPHTQHSEQVIRAAGAGKHVFVEKPFSLSRADAAKAEAAAERAGVVLAVGFNRRFHPSMGLLRDAVSSGRLGTLVTISAEQTALHGIAMTAEPAACSAIASAWASWLTGAVSTAAVATAARKRRSGRVSRRSTGQ